MPLTCVRAAARPSPPPGAVSTERVGRTLWLEVLAGQAGVACAMGERGCAWGLGTEELEMQGVGGLGVGRGFTWEAGRVASPGTGTEERGRGKTFWGAGGARGGNAGPGRGLSAELETRSSAQCLGSRGQHSGLPGY